MAPAAEAAAPAKQIRVYFLAAPEDQDVCVAIEKHLSPIVKTSEIPIEVRSDFNIPSGQEVEKHKQALFEADIVLALISADFIDDDDTYERNQRVIERYNNHETVMIPILVRNFMWRSTPFANLDVLPKNLQPINNKHFWNSEDDALTSVVSDIYDSINEFSRMHAMRQPAAPVAEPAPEVQEVAQASRAAPVAPGIEEGATASPKEVEPPTPVSVSAAQMSVPAPPVSVPAAPVSEPAPDVARETRQVQTATRAPVRVDWRRDYYRRVVWKRAAAIVLDYLILAFGAGVLAGLIGAAAGADEASINNLAFAAAVIAFYGVAPAMESGKRRATIGKRIMNLQITAEDGSQITFGRAMWRNILRSIVLYVYIVTLGVALLYQYFRFKKTRQLFHDELSNTVIGETLASRA